MSSPNIATQFDLPIVHRAYHEFRNLMVLDQRRVGGKKAAVLFSSNGLYFPNSEAVASRVLVEQDRFEWRHTLPLGCRRIVLVRDVFKTWYLRGISADVCDPFALAALLKQELDGWDVQMAGVSSGGYAAVLFGCLVGARRVFSLAGQFSLEPILEDPHQIDLNPSVVAAATDSSLRAFFDLRNLFTGRLPEIYYVAPKHSPVDELHRRLAGTEPRIRTLDIDSDQHDANLLRPALRRLFQRPSTYLDDLVRATPERGWNPVELSRRVAGNRRHFAYVLRKRRDLLVR